MPDTLDPGANDTVSVPSATEVLDDVLEGILQISYLHESLKANPVSVKDKLDAHKAKVEKACTAYEEAVSSPLTRVEYIEATWAYFSAVYPIDTFDWELRKVRIRLTKVRADMAMTESYIDDVSDGGGDADQVRSHLKDQYAMLSRHQAETIHLISFLESQREGLRIQREHAVSATIELWDNVAVRVRGACRDRDSL